MVSSVFVCVSFDANTFEMANEAFIKCVTQTCSHIDIVSAVQASSHADTLKYTVALAKVNE